MYDQYQISPKERLILELFRIKAIDFGEFKLKSGIISPYYLDLRLLVSYPYLLGVVAEVFWEELRLVQFDLLVGIPYAAIPIATVISYKYNRPMIFVRKEQKDYGKKRLIEGDFQEGQTVILIDDVISDGASKLETISQLQQEGLKVKNIIVLLDRSQNGKEQLAKSGYHLSCIYNMRNVLQILHKHKQISNIEEKQARDFIRSLAKSKQ